MISQARDSPFLGGSSSVDRGGPCVPDPGGGFKPARRRPSMRLPQCTRASSLGIRRTLHASNLGTRRYILLLSASSLGPRLGAY